LLKTSKIKSCFWPYSPDCFAYILMSNEVVLQSTDFEYSWASD